MAAFLHFDGVGELTVGFRRSFDAMNSSRIYRVRIVPKKIVQELQDGRDR